MKKLHRFNPFILFKAGFFSLACLLFVACATHTGVISYSDPNPSIQYQDIATGTAQTHHFLGIGGLSKDALILEAKRNMMLNRPLESGEAYANYTVDFKRSFFFIYVNTKVTLSADVVTMRDDNTDKPYTISYEKQLIGGIYNNTLFEAGDTILFGSAKEAVIFRFLNQDKAVVKTVTQNGTPETITLPITAIYTNRKSYKGLHCGAIYICYFDLMKQNPVKSQIYAFGIKNLIVKTQTNSLLKINYSEFESFKPVQTNQP